MGPQKTGNPYTYRGTFRLTGPFDWDAWVRFMDAHRTPSVEHVSIGDRATDGLSGIYSRTVVVGDTPGILRLTVSRTALSAIAHLTTTDEPSDFEKQSFRARVRHLLDLDTNRKLVVEHLSRDRSLRRIVRRHPGLGVPGCFSGFELAVRTILGQQVSLKGANTISGRLARSYGTPLPGVLRLGHPPRELDRLFPSPSQLARAAAPEIGSIGIPLARARTIRDLAAASAKHGWFETREPDLFSVRGVGPWTRAYIALRAYHDSDAFPASDLALRKAFTGKLLSERELLERSNPWQPYRGYAAMHLWRHYLDQQTASSAQPSQARRK